MLDANHNITPYDSSLRIDVDAVLKARLGRRYRLLPKFAIKWLEKIVRQDQLNDLLAQNKDRVDADFCHGVLQSLDISYHTTGATDLLNRFGRRVVWVCNHPLGGLDGLALIDLTASLYGEPVKFIVNDLLMAIKPLNGVFIPINKFGRQTRLASTTFDDVFAGDDPIVIFPAGLVSRRQKGGIFDLKWHKSFVNKCIQHNRPIIPVHFSGHNSSFFYNFARLRTIIGLKFNIEMILLPQEVLKSKGSHFTVTIGEPVLPSALMGGKDAQKQANILKQMVYALTSSNPVPTNA